MLATSKVIVQHKKDCFSKDDEFGGWSGIIDGSFYGNWNATPGTKKGNDHIWYKVTCNDPKCPAIKAVHSSVLVKA